jgi:hypothetical protein
MDFSTEKEATEAWGKVSANPSDPQYLETHQAMTRYYERAHPGEADLGVDPHLQAAMSRALADQQGKPPNQDQDAGAFEVPPAVLETDRVVDQALRAEFGDEYEDKKFQAFEVAEKIFGSKEKMVDFLIAYNLDLNAAKQIEAVKFLLKLAQK